MNIFNYTVILGIITLSSCKNSNRNSLLEYIEENTGFVIECNEADIQIQQPTEFLKIGSVKLQREDFRPSDIKNIETKGGLLPYFNIYADRVDGPQLDRDYQVWTDSSDNLSWCFAYDKEDELLWFALDYED